MRGWEATLRNAVVLALLGAVTGCGDVDARAGGSRAMTLDLDGVQVDIRSNAPFTRAEDFPWRVETTIAAALAFWGGDWSMVEGRSIIFVDQASVDCGEAQSLGCYDGDIRVTTRDPGTGTVACVEETVLIHEIGHLVLGDPDHTDPRWMDMGALAAELGGRRGYTATGESSCLSIASVWQHPLGLP